ncbi:hypothetical protein CLF_104839 [Clonorchis sinensis]|uniref:Uncharacterized protein n=1 Tax=Clonorchis sinensis TaxID=79923 RepID=G7YP10_CLOSI|nr:hypothetical protein CLF_104839 [Clonorchis sinensis]
MNAMRDLLYSVGTTKKTEQTLDRLRKTEQFADRVVDYLLGIVVWTLELANTGTVSNYSPTHSKVVFSISVELLRQCVDELGTYAQNRFLERLPRLNKNRFKDESIQLLEIVDGPKEEELWRIYFDRSGGGKHSSRTPEVKPSDKTHDTRHFTCTLNWNHGLFVTFDCDTVARKIYGKTKRGHMHRFDQYANGVRQLLSCGGITLLLLSDKCDLIKYAQLGLLKRTKNQKQHSLNIQRFTALYQTQAARVSADQGQTTPPQYAARDSLVPRPGRALERVSSQIQQIGESADITGCSVIYVETPDVVLRKKVALETLLFGQSGCQRSKGCANSNTIEPDNSPNAWATQSVRRPVSGVAFLVKQSLFIWIAEMSASCGHVDNTGPHRIAFAFSDPVYSKSVYWIRVSHGIAIVQCKAILPNLAVTSAQFHVPSRFYVQRNVLRRAEEGGLWDI